MPVRSLQSASWVGPALWFCRLSVGLLFIVSGLIKCNDIVGFSYKLIDYFNVFEDHFGLPAAPFVSMSVFLSALISVVETAFGLFLIMGYLPRLTAHLLLYMIVFFTFLTGYSWLTESVTDCGCFGDAFKLTPFQSFNKDLVLLVLIGFIFYFRKQIPPLSSVQVSKSVSWAGSAVFLVFTLYCWYYLPAVDFRKGCVGCNLKANTTEYRDDGTVPLPDYAEFSRTCDKDEFAGKSLLILYKDLEEASDEQILESIRLANDLAGTDIQIFGGTGSIPSVKDAMDTKYQFPFCMHVADGTMIKTMIRSNPGYVLMKDGIIVGKWPHTAIPTAEDIRNRAN